MTTIQEKLNKYTEFLDAIEQIENDRETALKEAIPEDIQDILAGINARYDRAAETASEGLDDLKNEIVKEVKQIGDTVHGETHMAVYSLRTSWDSKALTGYAAAHPEINEFKKETASVAIRKVNEKE